MYQARNDARSVNREGATAMSNVGDIERITQDRLIKVFTKELGYTYLGNLKDQSNSNLIESEFLSFQASVGTKSEVAKRAFDLLESDANLLTLGIYDRNEKIYNLLRYGLKLSANHGEKNQTISPIDFVDINRNRFAIAEEVTVVGNSGKGSDKRPDLVLYINGIAVGVIELKRSTVSIDEGIIQNLDNQLPDFIEHFFSTIQVVMAGNDTQGLKYGTVGTKANSFYKWREDNKDDFSLDDAIRSFCNKNRFTEMIYEFINFDRGTKMIARVNQVHAVNALKPKLLSSEGGVIWHTQGSGKSLTMVRTAKWIKENIDNSRVLILTDRTDLDESIEGVFQGVNETIHRTTSGKDLLDVLNTSTDTFVCSLIHKFKFAKNATEVVEPELDEEGENLGEFAEEVKAGAAAYKNFAPKGKIYIFIDECHRTQAGVLHKAMKAILPDAVIIGFTGTPILKNDKALTLRIFGEFIHTYKYDEGVRDGVIVDVLYEARDVAQRISNQEKIDTWFETKTRGLNDVAKVDLKKRWATLSTVLSSKERLAIIASDIILDMNTKPRLSSGRGNAILVASSIHEATTYFDLFQGTELKDRCGVVTSYVPRLSDLKGESVGDSETINVKQFKSYRNMIATFLKCNEEEALNRVDEYNEKAKAQFVNSPAQMKLLIVVDKLLTGFDAPSATYLFIDKKMRDHNLFQAICRVNRIDPDGEDKNYGYVVDYKDLFLLLENAIFDYTKGGFAKFDPSDIGGMIKDVNKQARIELDNQIESTLKLLEPVADTSNTQLLIKYFVGSNVGDLDEIKSHETKRVAFYKQVSAVVRAFTNIVGFESDAGYTEIEFVSVKNQVSKFEDIKQELRLASGDFIDLKIYEPDMRFLIDNYIKSDDSKVVMDFTDTPLLELLIADQDELIKRLPENIKKSDKSVAEVVVNNVKKEIAERAQTNPVYYEKMSILLAEIIQLDAENRSEYKKFLEKIADLAKKIKNPENFNSYPAFIKSAGERAIFEMLGEDEELSKTVLDSIETSRQDGWIYHPIKTRFVRKALLEALNDELIADKILDIAKRHHEFTN